MRTIYDNYRGFKISKDENKYKAVQNDIMFSQSLLSEVLDKIDTYIEFNFQNELAFMSPLIQETCYPDAYSID
ncbi:hypothetical protein [Paenibacillus sedimenti]|uniref:Uncharacterized protein n=1 Tax=Paenibacillus sedimenti TaxID=2770274 RepID=A0A926QH78_9BACL|nr:hypothetical protein [Paenibacillus sedimenti]MBD0379241.1 hypothetical protein [Paenibacillus sedimenti]